MPQNYWNPELLVSTACYDGYSLEVALKQFSEINVSLVELAYIEGYVGGFSEELFSLAHAKKVRRVLQESGIECRAVSAHTDLAEDDPITKIERRVRFVSEIGSSRLITNAARSENRDTFLRTIDAVIPVLEANNVKLLLENPGIAIENVVNDGMTARRTVEAIGHRLVGTNYDFGNISSHFLGQVRPEEDWQTVRNVVEYVHIKDVSLEGKNWCYPEIGTGDIDYESILSEISEDKRSPALGLELPLRLRRRPDATPFRVGEPLGPEAIREIVTRSIDFVRRGLGLRM